MIIKDNVIYFLVLFHFADILQTQMYFNDMGLPMEVDGIRFVPFYIVEGKEMYHLICQYTNYTDTL